jgi:EAL domain-containing protein (putative c-di-GMP-specific phosphodiesterase class I)
VGGRSIQLVATTPETPAWSTWKRFQMDGTSRAWLLAAAFAVFAVVYAPNSLQTLAPDDSNVVFGPASLLALGGMLTIAMSPVPIPRFLRQTRVTLLSLALLVVAVGGCTFQTDWTRSLLGDDPEQSLRLLETAAVAALAAAVILFTVRWVQTRRNIMTMWITGTAAVAVEAALLIPARSWEIRWWFAQLGIAVTTVIFVVSTDRRMARAINERELRLVYQPKMWLRTDEIAGVEALMRWQHPDFGLVPPNDFIPKAEATDLISPFTMWAVREAIRQHREWLDRGLTIPIAVNVPARLLRDDRLLELIKSELAARSLGPDAISLELTESESLESEATARETMTALADLGLRLAIDDFGTGYSGLTYIRNLPVHEVKLDQSFVRQMEHNEHDMLIVKSTVELVKGLGHKVIAEGIETEQVRDLLRSLGCDIGQGYYWSKPLPAADLEAWAKDHRPKAGDAGGAPEPSPEPAPPVAT